MILIISKKKGVNVGKYKILAKSYYKENFYANGKPKWLG
jgi:hypothetical protein